MLFAFADFFKDGLHPTRVVVAAVPVPHAVDEDFFRFLPRIEFIKPFQVGVRDEIIALTATVFPSFGLPAGIAIVTTMSAANNRIDGCIRPVNLIGSLSVHSFSFQFYVYPKYSLLIKTMGIRKLSLLFENI